MDTVHGRHSSYSQQGVAKEIIGPMIMLCMALGEKIMWYFMVTFTFDILIEYSLIWIRSFIAQDK